LTSAGYVAVKISLNKSSKSAKVDDRKPATQDATSAAQPQAPKVEDLTHTCCVLRQTCRQATSPQVTLRAKNAGHDKTALLQPVAASASSSQAKAAAHSQPADR